VASATNDHRLGANEAPPAIISIFLGDQLADVFEQIAGDGLTSSKGKGAMQIGVDTLPVLPTDPGDRNRTSPFAFTGNRFEFRAPGSMQTVAAPIVTINTIMAESLDFCATALENATGDFDAAVQELLKEIISEHGAVVFNGDGYSEKWQAEAAERGLPNLRTTLDALPELVTEPAMELFAKYGVFNHREMHSRYEIALEQYAMTVGVEAKLTAEMGATQVLPAAVRYQTEMAQNVATLKAAGIDADVTGLEEISALVTGLRAALATLKAELADHSADTTLAEAEHAGAKLLPAMAAVREAADELENMVADDLWPLPTYQEMLFIL
jgi:glutamine synthetase